MSKVISLCKSYKSSIESMGVLYLTRFTRSHSVNNILLVYIKQKESSDGLHTEILNIISALGNMIKLHHLSSVMVHVPWALQRKLIYELLIEFSLLIFLGLQSVTWVGEGRGWCNWSSSSSNLMNHRRNKSKQNMCTTGLKAPQAKLPNTR